MGKDEKQKLTTQKDHRMTIGPYGTVITDAINTILGEDIFRHGDTIDAHTIALHLRRILKQPDGARKLSEAFGIDPTITSQGGFFVKLSHIAQTRCSGRILLL